MAPSFPQRKIGDDSVSAIGFGCMSLAIAGPEDDEASFKVLTTAADMGINFWVTSDSYRQNEALLGRWFRETGRRDEIFLVSKFGVKWSQGNFGAGIQPTVDGSPAYVKEACEKSLEKLCTDRIDLYMAHRIDPKVPIEKTIEAMAQLKLEGKIKYLGLSECSTKTLIRASKVHPIAGVEMEYSPFALDIETTDNFLKTARELGVKIIPYSPLGRGFMTGTIKSRDDFDEKDLRKIHPRFSEDNFANNLKIVEGFEAMASDKGCRPGQLALAWVLAQGEDFIPIPGTKHIKYLKENAGAVEVEFTKEDEEKIRKVIDSVDATGARYPEPFLSQCFGDTPELGSD